MKETILKRILKVLIVICILLVYLSLMMSDIVTYASSDTGEENVIFEAYFENENGERVSQIEKSINSEDIRLHIKVEVKNEGYLNGQLELRNANFKFKQEEIEGVNEITDNTIALKQINAGETLDIQVGLEVNLQEEVDLANFNQENSIVLTGSYKNAMQKESSIEKENKIKVALTAPYSEEEEKVKLDTRIITNKIYNINGENKRIIQIAINSGLEKEGYPIGQTKINVQAPEGAEEVTVQERGTQATNGKDEWENDGESLKSEQNENGLNIEINNIQKDGKIYYGREKQDKIIVTYVYAEDMQLAGEIKTKASIQIYDEYGTILEKEVTNAITEESDEIIGYQITNEQNIYKGKMYAKEEQEYKNITSIDIRYPGIEQNIKLNEGQAVYREEIEGELHEEGAKLVYKTSLINKEELLKVIGDNGELVIKKTDGTEISKINKEKIDAEETEWIKVTYPENQSEIVIEINNAQNTGTINLLNQKAIKQETLDRETLKMFNNILVKGTLQQTGNINERNIESNISLQDTQTKAKLELNNSQLTAGTKNENVELKATLVTNENKYDLYKNPTIEIAFPQEVKDVTINSVNILYGTELAKQSEEVYQNEQGMKVIKVQLAGEQTKHTETGLVEGANIVVNCDVTVDNMEQNASSNIVMRYSNEQNVQYDNNGISETTLNYIVKEENKEEQQVGATPTEETEPQATDDPITVTKRVSSGNGADIYETQVQKYTITVKNNTDQAISNIKVEDDIPAELVYADATCDFGFHNGYEANEDITKFSTTLETLEAGKEIDVYYFTRVRENDENIGKTVGTKARVIANNVTYESNLVENTIKESKLQIDMVTAANATSVYKKDSEIDYKIVLKNITDEKIENLIVKNSMPEGTSYIDGGEMLWNDVSKYWYIAEEEESNNIKKAEYDSENQIVTWKIGDLEAGEEIAVYLIIKLNAIQGEESLKTIQNSVSVQVNDVETYYSNVEEITQINVAKCTITLSTNLTDKYLYEGDEFEYIITVTNTSTIRNANVIVMDQLPKGVFLISCSYTINGEKKELQLNSISVTEELKPGETMIITARVKADELAQGVDELEVKNKANLSNPEIGEIESNEITNIIRRKNNGTDEEPGENPGGGPGEEPGEDPGENNKNYNISGTAWIDQNRNGEMDNQENTLQGITVELYDTEGNIAKDNNGKDVISTTGSDGRYILSNLPQGNYIAIFRYDNRNYTLTEYKKSGVTEELNSDVITTTLNGTTVATTDNIQITNNDITNINIGLLETNKFDLRLNKYISTITVQGNGTTKKYGYNNTDFAKIEIDRKTINNSTVTIEYKISVTNEGEVAGYANKVVDYLSSDLNFNAQLNEDWVLENGQLVNGSLAEEIINPGETKTLDLVLTKALNEENLGTVTNTAEIMEDSNDNLIEDIDSTPGNKNTNEDDISTVSVIVSVGTGRTILYICLITTIIAILGIGIYLIKDKVLTKDERR